MKRKLLILFLVITSVFACAFGLSACDSSDNNDNNTNNENTEQGGNTGSGNGSDNETEDGNAGGGDSESGSGPETPVTPTTPKGCNHIGNLENFYDEKQPSCTEEGYSLDVLVCTNVVNENGQRLVCGMIFSTDEKETEPIGQLPLSCREEYTFSELGESGQIEKYLIKYRTTLDKLPHTPVTDAAVPATCCTKGLTEGSHCGVCDEVIKAQVETDYSDHDYSDEIQYTDAVKETRKVCSACGKLKDKELIFKAALNNGNTYTLEKADGWTSLDFNSVTYNGKTITEIGDEAFSKCTALTSVNLSGSITKIGYAAFADCSDLTDISLNNGLSEIGDFAFQRCGVTTFTIPDSVEEVGISAFVLCENLTTLTVGKGVVRFGNRAFKNCSSLDTVYWNATACKEVHDADHYEALLFDDCTSLTTVIIGDNVTKIPDSTFAGCPVKNLTMPFISSSLHFKYFIGNYNANTGTLVSGAAPTSLENVTVKGGDISANAFEDCSSLKTVTIGNEVTSIGSMAFSGCSALTDIHFKGTKEQFKTICSGYWNYNTGSYTVHCSDGDIAKADS